MGASDARPRERPSLLILVVGLYGALALVIEDTSQRTVLPLFRRQQL